MNEQFRPTQEELADAKNVMRRIQVQIRYPAELVERAIRTIVRDELAKQEEQREESDRS